MPFLRSFSSLAETQNHKWTLDKMPVFLSQNPHMGVWGFLSLTGFPVSPVTIHEPALKYHCLTWNLLCYYQKREIISCNPAHKPDSRFLFQEYPLSF